MNTDKNIVYSAVKFGIRDALSFFGGKNNGDTLSDIYIRIDEENSRIEIFDDMENLLAERIIELWPDDQNGGDNYEQAFIKASKTALQELKKEGAFKEDFLCKPFSISLVDESFIIVEELFFIDDENLKLDCGSLINLDKELDDFLKNLMEDVE